MTDYRAKLTSSLILQLDKLAVALHEQANAVRANTEATEKATKQKVEQPPLASPLPVELYNSIATTVQGETKTHIKNSWDWRDYLRLSAELIGLIVLVWYACTTRGLWIESQKQVGIMQKQLELTDRPWVKINVTANTDWVPGAIIGGPLMFDRDGRGSLTAKIVLENIGKSVANHAYVREQPFATGRLRKKWRRLSNSKRCFAMGQTRIREINPSRSIRDTRYSLMIPRWNS